MSSELILGFSLGAVAGSAALIWWVHFGEICFNPNCESESCNQSECPLPDTGDNQTEFEALTKKVKDVKDDIVEEAKDVVVEFLEDASKRKNRSRKKQAKKEK